jgi:hypothetical protein
MTNSTYIGQIEGRVCPTHVFLTHSNMTATSRCLYYDSGNAAQTLDAAGTGLTQAEDWLQTWDNSNTGRGISASYFEGNIKTCADKGMRLSVAYETTMSQPGMYLPTADGITPTWAGANGVPSYNSSFTWTASANTNGNTSYWSFNGTNINMSSYTSSVGVRCVLP